MGAPPERLTICLLLLLPLVFTGCRQPRRTPASHVVEADTFSFSSSPRDTAMLNLRHRRMQAELDYYLQRHDVQDEGFDMVARYAAEGDSTMSAYMPTWPVTLRNVIHWRTWPREGTAVDIDHRGRVVIGTWHADTLVSAVRLDSCGIYAGQANRHLEACGHGSYRGVDGSYYEGHWHHDQRSGFGFCVSATNLRAGTWLRDRFVGERMHYTTDRIYGIDISRYQHERGRRVYPINWRRLRITSLGHRISREQVSGSVDYPVTFVYIKATEGISIKNKYFVADYLSARRQGLRTGVYHFFSTRQDAADQASHFLRNARFTTGDLPPVLDVEPTDGLIEQMGGPEALFAAIRTWTAIVGRATKTRPILYVNQRFVNKYLDMAPDLLQDCHFWIARYGQYRPDIHLALWQLSADGRVHGITGEVDINVFNGYQGQWDEFLREACVP